MAKKTGKCKRKDCKNAIAMHGVANEMRYCNEHYEQYDKKKKDNFTRRVSKRADAIISGVRISTLEGIIRNDKAREVIAQKKINTLWVSKSRERKSDVTSVIKSREWLNTQELLKKKLITCQGNDFMGYVRNVIKLYTLKLLHSRVYLDEYNAYQKHSIPARGKVTPLITLNLEVAFTFNPSCNVSNNSNDIVIVPQKIRRAFTLNKALSKGRMNNVIENSTSKGGIYRKIKAENTPEEVTFFMSKMKLDLDLDFKLNKMYGKSLSEYAPFLSREIRNILPLFELALVQYGRIHRPQVLFAFRELKKILTHEWVYIELFALLSFHYLMKGSGGVLVEKAMSWIEYKPENGVSLLTHIISEIDKISLEVFNVNASDGMGFVKMYNSFFSGDVIKMNSEGVIVSLLKKELYKK
ncbi:hypothetical protein GJV06_04980 [Enterobacteriaceae bacterium RIT691]|uniref:hypothetical protein n=1 Tax=Scandinavium tedordense TaxID=2926521 RepID=UPI0012AEA1FF|nr:hypothetical protein [Scandinavium tedordense]MCS2169574.1 hypothetical protein [Scandinavium tedordense]MRS14241.1 hypothetical protein [Enterobacteriaceae bacterium RIT691]